ncbi:hypothetical protein Tco_0351778 [Tanacetum coccineum]
MFIHDCRNLCEDMCRMINLFDLRKFLFQGRHSLSNPNKDAKSGSTGNKEVIGSVVEVTSLLAGGTLSKFRNLLAKLDETEE